MRQITLFTDGKELTFSTPRRFPLVMVNELSNGTKDAKGDFAFCHRYLFYRMKLNAKKILTEIQVQVQMNTATAQPYIRFTYTYIHTVTHVSYTHAGRFTLQRDHAKQFTWKTLQSYMKQ